MKCKVKGLVFVGFAAAILAGAAHAAGENIVTSQAYTEATYQHKLGGTEQANKIVQATATPGTVNYIDTATTAASITSLDENSTAAQNGALTTAKAVHDAIETVNQTATSAQVKSTADFQLGGAQGVWKTVEAGNYITAPSAGVAENSAKFDIDTTKITSSSELANNGTKLAREGDVKGYVDGKIGGNVNSSNTTTAPTGATIAAAIDDAITQNNSDTAYSSTSPAMITVDSTNHTISAVAGTVATGQTGLVSGGQVADAIAAAQQTNATNYQEKSTDSYQVGGAGGTWETMTAGTYTTLTRDATTDPDNPTVKYDINATTTASGVTTGATTIPTSGAVADAIAAATGNQNIPAKDTSVCTATYPCALVAEGNRLNWRVMAVSAGQLTPAGTCGNADDNCGDA